MSIFIILAPAAIVGAIAEYVRCPQTRRKAHNLIHALTYTDPRRRAKRTFNC